MMKRRYHVRSLVAASVLLMVLLVPVAWAAGETGLPQQGDGGRGGAELAPGKLVSVTGTVDVRVIQSPDDAEEQTVAPWVGLVQTKGHGLDLGTGPVGPQWLGLRFANLGIPKAATITQAYIQFTASDTQDGAANLTIYAEASDNAAPYKGSNDFDISTRSRLATSVNWNAVPAWPAEGGTHQTPDLKALVQQIVARAGWTPSNAMAFDITGSGQRTAWSWDGEASKAPRLVVGYVGTVACAALTTGAYPVGTGQVEADPPPNCEGNKYYVGTTVELTAIPTANNYAFANWSVGATGTANPTTITMTAAKSVTANFVEKTCYRLTGVVVPVVDPAIGEIRPDPESNCGGGKHIAGTVVTLSAVPRGGWQFTGWSGDLSGTVNPETLTMDGNKTVTAAFSEACRRINIDIQPPGSGTVSTSPPPNCPTSLSKWLPGTVVELRATPAKGYFFVKWSVDGVEARDNPTSITMDGNKSVDATFREGSHHLLLPALFKRKR